MKSKLSRLGRLLLAAFCGWLASQAESQAQVFSVSSITNNGNPIYSIGLRFTVPVQPSATNVADYLVNNGTVTVTNVILHTNNVDVDLGLGQAIGRFYSVTISNVATVFTNTIHTIVSGFTSPYPSVTIGDPDDPDPTGQVFTASADWFEVTVGGSGIGSTEDHFHFIYQETVGDFDVQTRVWRLDAGSPQSQAGLMARETLDKDSAMVTTYFTAPAGSNDIEVAYRDFAGDTATDGGFQIGPRASATPLRWLRLTRSNNVFTAYYGTNGANWTISGVTTQALATNLLVGLATSANAPAGPAGAPVQEPGAQTTSVFSDFTVQGAQPGDTVIPTLSASLSGSNLAVTWPATPSAFTIEMSTNLYDWSLLFLPTTQPDSTSYLMNIPLALGGNRLFVRLIKVDVLIPKILSIGVSPGTILSPGNGMMPLGNSGNVFCGNTINFLAAYASIAPFTIPAGKVGTFNTTASDYSVDTYLQLRDASLVNTRCNDDSAGNLKSQVLTSAFNQASGNFSFVVVSKTDGAAGAIKVRVNY